MSESKNTSHPDAPPSYAMATGSSTSSKPASGGSHLEVPQARNGIPAAQRRSMEDEGRKLPPGWIRQFDSNENHQFFVDTKANPPRSIWHHPYDDDEYLRSLSSEERERIQEEERDQKRPLTPSSMDEETHHFGSGGGSGAQLPPRPDSHKPSISSSHDKKSIGTKLKDRLTGTTKEERDRDRAIRDEEERNAYEAHMRYRQCLQRAQMTGQPQWFAKDRDGRDIYIEPPYYGGGFGGGYGMSPYRQGIYSTPNALYVRPPMPYGRPYGRPGYGGGMGLPIAGGLLGGMALGSLLF